MLVADGWPVTRDRILSTEARVQDRFAWLWQPLGGRGRPGRCAAREASVRITRLRMSQFPNHEQVASRYAMTPNSIAISSVHMLQASGGGEFSRPANISGSQCYGHALGVDSGIPKSAQLNAYESKKGTDSQAKDVWDACHLPRP